MSSRRNLIAQSSTDGSNSDFDRSSTPSPFSMDEQEDHHYANPLELKPIVQVELDKIDGRKKRNLLYESLPLSEEKQNGFHKNKRKESFDNNNNTHIKLAQNDRLYKFLFMMMFLMSFGAFLLSILTSFGIINNCGKCSSADIQSPTLAKQIANTQSVDALKIHALEQNMTELHKHVIPSLLRQLTILQAKTINESFQGPPGPAGPVGAQGPSGSGDLSKCRYRVETTTSAFSSSDPDIETKTETLKVGASDGNIIIGAACTCIGGSEYGLFQIQVQGKTRYYCRCAGKAITKAFENSSLKCRLHYWECPIKS